MLFSALQKFKKNKNIIGGFTLIELLVVISIIAILTAVATVSYTNVQQKSRDGKRKSDLAAIQQALEQFKADTGYYPSSADWDYISCNTWEEIGIGNPARTVVDSKGVTHIDQSAIVWGSPWTCASGVTYMAKIPSDPVGGSYRYYYEIFEASQSGNNKCTTGDAWSYGGGLCQRYALYAVLENKSDPDIDKTMNESICPSAVNPPPDTDDGHPSFYDPTKLHSTDLIVDTPPRSFVNYCVHSP